MEDKPQNVEEPRPDESEETQEDSRDPRMLIAQRNERIRRTLRLIHLVEEAQERLKHEFMLFLQEFLKGHPRFQ